MFLYPSNFVNSVPRRTQKKKQIQNIQSNASRLVRTVWYVLYTAILYYTLLAFGKRVDKIQHKYLYYCGLGQKEEEDI